MTTPPTAPGAGLARLGFERTDLAERLLGRLGAWPPGGPEGGGDLLAELAGSASPDLATRVLADLVDAHPEPDRLAADLRRHPGLRRRLVAVAAASRSIGSWLVAHPDQADRLADDAAAERSRPAAELRAEALEVVAGDDLDGAWEALRRFKRRELVRVAARDLLDAGAGTEQVAFELAGLAEACLEAALALAVRGLGAASPVRLAVLGMGKLGGAELNYTSDVDVMVVHEPGGEEAAKAADRAVQALVQGLGVATREGSCYRVDLDLRPEGRNGPLSRTLASYQAYWERWAEPWEFQALIKVRPAAGDAELAERFCAATTARVYPEALEAGAVAEIRRMKARVEDSVRAQRVADRHVKLGPGGIRDIEWAVQLLQLVHGRQDPTLRSASTLGALAALADAGLVGRADAGQLAEAYRFLRTVEHRLQLADERQTHVIPTSEREQRWLARVLGYRDGPEGTALEAFDADRRRHAATVRTLHEKLFYRPLLEAFGAVPPLSPEQERDRLVGLGFADPDRALAHLRALTEGLSRSAALMRLALPVMLPWIAATPDPDRGLLAFRSVAERLGDRPAFLAIVRENPVAAERLCAVLGASPLLGDLLSHHPELVDAFGDQERYDRSRSAAELRAEALALVHRHAGLGEIGGGWDALRRFKRRELVRVAVRDLLDVDQIDGNVGAEQVGAELSGLAEACLAAGLALALRASGEEQPVRLALLGMGKLGGAELNYTSDLDILAVHEPVGDVEPQVAAKAADKLVQALVHGLGVATREGSCYPVDLDLRPEGRNGPLSRTLESYEAYWQRWAEPWEFQALVKLRPVAGDAELAERFSAAAARRVYQDRLEAGTLAELRRMKARVETERLPRGADPKLHLKLGPGGLADVEWTAQLLQLQHGGADPALREPSTRSALAKLEAAGLLKPDERRWLLDAYDLCTRIRNVGYLVTGRPLELLPTDQGVLTRLARVLKLPGERQELLEAHRRATRRARAVVEQRFWGGRL